MDLWILSKVGAAKNILNGIETSFRDERQKLIITLIVYDINTCHALGCVASHLFKIDCTWGNAVLKSDPLGMSVLGS